jgi:hypothetical protein
MLRKVFLVAGLLALCLGLFAQGFEWGVKYGAGFSSVWGEDTVYDLNYKLTGDDATTNLSIMSDKNTAGFAQNAGLFFTIPLVSDKNMLLLQPEILWQSYSYFYKYEDMVPTSSDPAVNTAFSNSQTGSVKACMDYVTVPVLLKLQQNYMDEGDENHAIVNMFGYAGPSVSYLISNYTTLKDDIKDMKEQLADYVGNSDVYNSYSMVESGPDQQVDLKYDLVLGFGWNFKNVLKAGFGKDEWVLDVRADINLNSLGDNDTGNDFKLYGVTLNIGYKF